MKKLLILFAFYSCFSIAQGQTVLFVEEFNYPAGDVLTAHNWLLSGTSNTNPITVTAPGLTFANYPSAAGNACTLTTTGQDVYQTFSPVSSGSIYLAFLANVQSAQTGFDSTPKADYFITFSPSVSQTYYTCRVTLKANGNGFSIGVSKSTETTSVYPYGNTIFNFNVTYLVVVKYTFNTGSNTDDAISVYVLSSLNSTTMEPTTPEVGPYVCSDVSKTDQADLSMVTLRQGSNSSAAALIIDGIRIATNWGIAVRGVPTAVNYNVITIPGSFALMQNYPNPFNPETVIGYQLPAAGFVTLKIYDVLGKEVATLVNEFKQAGSYNVQLLADSYRLSSGIYFYRITAGNNTAVKKMVVMK